MSAGLGHSKCYGSRERRYRSASHFAKTETWAGRPHDDGPEAWCWAAATGVLWGLSYCFGNKPRIALRTCDNRRSMLS